MVCNVLGTAPAPLMLRARVSRMTSTDIGKESIVRLALLGTTVRSARRSAQVGGVSLVVVTVRAVQVRRVLVPVRVCRISPVWTAVLVSKVISVRSATTYVHEILLPSLSAVDMVCALTVRLELDCAFVTPRGRQPRPAQNAWLGTQAIHVQSDVQRRTP